MNEILELAAQLGKRIAADPRTRRLGEAQDNLQANLADKQLLADYEEHQQRIHSLEVQNKPIEPDDKRRLADLHDKVISNETIKSLLKAQADYLELMAAVSQQIEHHSFHPESESADA